MIKRTPHMQNLRNPPSASAYASEGWRKRVGSVAAVYWGMCNSLLSLSLSLSGRLAAIYVGTTSNSRAIVRFQHQ